MILPAAVPFQHRVKEHRTGLFCVQRALTDYRDVGGGGGPDGTDGFDDDGDGDDHGGGPDVFPQTGLVGRLAQMLGADPHGATADPQAVA